MLLLSLRFIVQVDFFLPGSSILDVKKLNSSSTVETLLFLHGEPMVYHDLSVVDYLWKQSHSIEHNIKSHETLHRFH